MAVVNTDAFYKYEEHRGMAGYKSALLVQEPGREKYSMLIASETVPSIQGSQSTFEFDLLNSPVTGRIAGKSALEEKEVSCLLHRDNIWRFEQLRGKVLNFMHLTPDFVGYKFSGTVTFRPNDAEADVLRGTYTIVPMSAQEKPILNVRDMVEETLCFALAIPENIKSGDKINLAVVQAEANATYKQFVINDNGVAGEGTPIIVSDGTATINGTGLIGITAEAEGYAPWTTTVYVYGA